MSYQLLKGKKGIIFGVLNKYSIAWKVAKYAYKNGASLILTNTPAAIKIGDIKNLSNEINSKVIAADATSMTDLNKLFSETLLFFDSKIDFLLHSIGNSINIRKKKPYTNLDYSFLTKSWDVSAVSFHKIMKVAWDKNAINNWGSIVALTYIGSEKFILNYNDMSDFKSYLESIARNFGYYWGSMRKVRVNTVSQSPTYTTASNGIEGFEKFIKYSDKLSPLGNANAEECAKFIVTLFSDLTNKITMQNIYHDGGFSNTSIDENIMK